MAKLRMHNDLTLDIMEAVTVLLGQKLRDFSQTTCTAFDTRELRREYEARIRCQTRKAATKNCETAVATSTNRQATNGSEETACQSTSGKPPSRRRKTLNLSTFKIHSLGDYVHTIRMYGTTDSYSTEPVCDVCLRSL